MGGIRNTSAFANQPLLPVREDGNNGGGLTDMFGNRISNGGSNARPSGGAGFGMGRPAPLDRAPSAYLPALGPATAGSNFMQQQQRLAPLTSIANSVPSPSSASSSSAARGLRGSDRYDTNGLLEFFGDDALREDDDDGDNGNHPHTGKDGRPQQQQQRPAQKPSPGFTEIDAATAELELQALMTLASPQAGKSAGGGSGVDRATIDAVREQIHETLGKFKVCV